MKEGEECGGNGPSWLPPTFNLKTELKVKIIPSNRSFCSDDQFQSGQNLKCALLKKPRKNASNFWNLYLSCKLKIFNYQNTFKILRYAGVPKLLSEAEGGGTGQPLDH